MYYDAEVTNEITTEATCTASGVRTYTATYDGHTGTQMEAIEKTEHTPSQISIPEDISEYVDYDTGAASVTVTYICSECEEEFSDVCEVSPEMTADGAQYVVEYGGETGERFVSYRDGTLEYSYEETGENEATFFVCGAGEADPTNMTDSLAITVRNRFFGMDVTGISSYAFNGSAVTSLTLGTHIVTLESNAFEGATYLQEISLPSNLTALPEFAFSGCIALTSVTVPTSVQSVGEGAFAGCTSLEELTIPFVGGSAATEAVEGTTWLGYLFGTEEGENLTGVTESMTGGGTTRYLPDTLTTVRVTGSTIVSNAFVNCSSVTNVIVGENVTTMQTEGFTGLRLTSLTFEDTTSSWTVYDAEMTETIATYTAEELADTETALENMTVGVRNGYIWVKAD